jgi:hypothetical protein
MGLDNGNSEILILNMIDSDQPYKPTNWIFLPCSTIWLLLPIVS